MPGRALQTAAIAAGLVITSGLAVSCARGQPVAQPTPPAAATATPDRTPSPVPSPPTPAPSATPPKSSATTPKPPTLPKPTSPKPATPTVPAALLGKDITAIPTSQPVVALTFDGGANADGLASILATLSAEQVSATFFLTGEFATRYPSSVRAIVAAGHRLGNHTATHPHLPQLSDAAVIDQLLRAETQIGAAGGTNPRPLFRFPYGDRTAHTIAVVNGLGYLPVRWTVDTLGWKGTSGGITAQIVVDRVVGAARAGEIVLMHVGSNPDDHTTLDAQALPTVVSRLRAMGYRFVTLNALL